jgi:hypothetical protein
MSEEEKDPAEGGGASECKHRRILSAKLAISILERGFALIFFLSLLSSRGR